MKLLVFSPYYPPHTGGLETHSDEFNKYLSRHGVDITVFTPHLPMTAPPEELLHEKVQIIRFPAFEIIPNYPLPQFWLPSFWKLLFSLREKKPDIIISRTRFFFSSLIALIFSKTTHTKLIHIEHGSDFVKLSSSIKNTIAKLYDHIFGRMIFCCSDKNISISKAVRKFVRKFDQRESPVIYRGIDFDAIDSIPKDESFRDRFPEKIIITTAARLYKWKGIENTIKAIEILPENLKSKIIFLIIGDGEDFQHLKKLAQDLPIEMVGKLSREETIATFKASDIYIHSSLPGGGLSTSLLEAMYCQCAIIATPNEGANEVIVHEKNGILIGDSSSPQEIHEAIARLIESESERTIFSKIAQKDTRERFSWNTSIQKYLAIFTVIVKK